MAMFKGFKPQGLQKIANSMGYTGSLEGFDSYLQQNPDKQNMMNMYNQRAVQMAQGGAVRRMAVGGVNVDSMPFNPFQAGQFQSAMPTGNPADQVFTQPEGKTMADITALDKQISGQGFYAQPTQLQGVKQVLPQGKVQSYAPDTIAYQQQQPAITAGDAMALRAAPRPTSFNYTREQALGRDMQKDVKSPEEQLAIDRALGRSLSSGPGEIAEPLPQPGFDIKMFKDNPRVAAIFEQYYPGMSDEEINRRMNETARYAVEPDLQTTAQPDPRQQAYVPTLGEGPGQVPAYGPTVDADTPDPYADYRQNVEKFPETGAFKNPAIQTSFDDMTKELEANLGDTPTPDRLKQRSDKVLDYVRNVYSGPIYQSEAGVTGLGANNFTDEFKQYARDSGLSIVDSPVADGPDLLDAQKNTPITTTPGYLPPPPASGVPTIGDVTTTLAQTGAIPVGAVTQPELIQTEDGQFIDPKTGQLAPAPTASTAVADTAQADPAQQVTATKMEAVQAAPAVETALQANLAAQTDPNDPRAQITAAQQTSSSVGDLNAAQGNATLMDNPVQREIQDGELISGVADAEKASKFTEQIEAATATPSEKATVQGQLAQLTADFDMSNPPPWAAGALRGVQAQLQQRGLGASSIAGQALIQGALESALPIAQADAQTQAQFESQNLSNRQQRAMLAAQQRATFIGQEFDQAFQARVQNAARIGDVANMNFTAQQQVALENSRITNTMNLQNLSNNQAMVMAEAAALSQLDMANLSNVQQASVQNAQNFLQMEMANLSNEQQTSLFNAQAINQSILTDQAAQNAANQFNATTQNQVDQFMSSLANQVSQFNATQSNAQNQFNAGELNTLERFNTEVANQRDQFNATNQLAIAQNNAVWRREIATADTAAINRANELNAKAVLDVSNQQYNNLWTFYADTMEWAWKSAESEQDRLVEVAVANINADASKQLAEAKQNASSTSAIGNIIGQLGSAYIKGIFKT
jgi:hypothetical protein